jgi:hypothetical protein
LNILYLEMRIRIEQIIFSRPITELSQDQLNRDSRPPDDRLSHHHLGIDLYAIRNRHTFNLLLFTFLSASFKSSELRIQCRQRVRQTNEIRTAIEFRSKQSSQPLVRPLLLGFGHFSFLCSEKSFIVYCKTS